MIMERKLKVLIDNILKEETKRILDEIDRLINKEGMGETLIDGSKKNDTKPGRSQFKSLMDAAEKASCVEELILFLAYQKSKGNGWDKKVNNEMSVAEKIEHSLDLVIGEISEIIGKRPEAENMSADDERIMKLMIAEKYMGYLYWNVSIVSR